MKITRGTRPWLGLVAGIALVLTGLAQSGPADAEVNSLSIVPVAQTVPTGATEITISVELEAAAPGIGGWDLNIVFDEALLRPTGCSPIAGGVCSVLAQPIVNFGGKSAAGLTGNPLQLGTVTFEAADTGGSAAIDPIIIQLRDPSGADITPPPLSGGEVVVQPPLKQGDANCNDSVNSVDALLILRFAAGLVVNENEACADIGTVLALAGVFGDVDCTGVVNSVDALKILRFGVGLPVAQNEPPACVDLGQLLP